MRLLGVVEQKKNMGCKICGRGACASWMHSVEEQEEWQSVENLTDDQMKREIIDLRRQVKELERQISVAGLDA